MPEGGETGLSTSRNRLCWGKRKLPLQLLDPVLWLRVGRVPTVMLPLRVLLEDSEHPHKRVWIVSRSLQKLGGIEVSLILLAAIETLGEEGVDNAPNALGKDPRNGPQVNRARYLACSYRRPLLRELGEQPTERWQRQARVLDKLYAPTRYPDALGDELPADVFGPEDAEVALEAATALLNWARQELG